MMDKFAIMRGRGPIGLVWVIWNGPKFLCRYRVREVKKWVLKENDISANQKSLHFQQTEIQTNRHKHITADFLQKYLLFAHYF